jgi:hypothetical protein
MTSDDWRLEMPHRYFAATLALALIGALFWVPVALFWLGISPSGFFEESVGYRYFYSLRLAFGGEHPFLPQGQLPTFVNVIIQWALSAFYPTDQLFARIDVFSLAAVAVPGILGTVAAYYALTHLPWPGMILMAACAFLLLASPKLFAGIGWTAMPDYHVWTIPLAFLCLGLTLTDEPLTLRQATVLGVAAGLAVGVKVTLCVFPLVPLATRIPLDRRALSILVIFGMAGTLVYLAIVALYTGLDLRAFQSFFASLALFIRSQANTLPADAWAQIWGYELLVICLLPPVLIAIGFILRERAAFAAALALTLSLLFLGLRPYNHTLIEVHAVACLAVGVMIAVVARPTEGAPLRRLILPSAAVAILPLLLMLGPERVSVGIDLIQDMGEIDRAHAEWRSKLTQPAWIATTSNYYRPLSIEGALCKGSRGIFAPEISRYLTSLFPDFHCALGQNELTGVESSSVGFVRLPTESLAGSIKRVEDYFSVSLGMHDCQEIASPGTFLVYCLPGRVER